MFCAFLRRLDNDLARVDHSVTALAPRITEIETMLPSGISFTGVVAYDAFGDIAGNQSRSIALLDRRGNGLVISLLVGRGETRFYTKQVTAPAGRRAALARRRSSDRPGTRWVASRR